MTALCSAPELPTPAVALARAVPKLDVALANSLPRLAVAALADARTELSAATMELEAAGAAVDSCAARDEDALAAARVMDAIWLPAAAVSEV